MEYKFIKFRLQAWRKLRLAFYGRKHETFSDYIERIAKEIKLFKDYKIVDEALK